MAPKQHGDLGKENPESKARHRHYTFTAISDYKPVYNHNRTEAQDKKTGL